MSDEKDTIEVDDDFVIEEPEDVPPVPVETTKANLSKRRTIDNLLEERRLQRQLADYDFDF
ncbi:PA3496 family putative envelope integrity protein [Pseudomonas sp. NPDC078416]|uniref:PA3496 family putative envelope integrity protein n=1 Tax=Pseudomonas sp. NPDC078416 TaxID=3390637 RepID=UPI003D07B19B